MSDFWAGVCFVCSLHSFRLLHGACLAMGLIAYSPGGPPFSFPLLFIICRVSLSSSPSNLHQTKLYAVFVSTCLSSQTIPVWVIDDDPSLSPDTPPCWDKHCKHGLLSCTIFALFLVCVFWHSVGFGFGLLLRNPPYLTTVNYHQGWVGLVLSFCLESCAGHVFPYPITAYRQIQTDTDSSMVPTFKTATLPLIFGPGYVLLLH